jgi:tryptophan 2,3-dioxygenase
MHSRPSEPRPQPKVLNPSQPVALLRYEYDRGSNYEDDTRVITALSALVPEEELHHPDHRFFQLVHLITEYAWVGIHHELCRVSAAFDADDPARAVTLLRRCAGLADLPIRAARLFEEHLSQDSMLAMRDNFPPETTGLDSPGMRNLRRAARAVWSAFEAATGRAATTLNDLTAVVGRPGLASGHDALLAEAMNGLQRFDAKVVEWKQVHITMVWMLIGGHPQAATDLDTPTSLRGRPISDLERLSTTLLFPRLWRHSTQMFLRGPAGTR